MSTVKSRKKLLPPQNFLRRFCTALLLSTLHLSTPTNGDEILDGSSSASGTANEENLQGEKTAFACQGTRLHLKCLNQSEVIKVTRANYGRFSIAVCNDKSMTTWSVNCFSSKAKEVFANNCNNFAECHILAEDFDFGPNPCPDTERYLEASYVCVPRSQNYHEAGQSPLWTRNKETRTSLNSVRRKPQRRVPITAPPPVASSSTTFSSGDTSTAVMMMTTSGEELTSSATPISTFSYTFLPKISTSTVKTILGCATVAKRGIAWPFTPAGSVSVKQCSKGTKATWFCQSSGVWSPSGPDLSNCQGKKWKLRPPTELENLVGSGTINLYGGDIVPLLDLVASLTDQFRSTRSETNARSLARTLSLLLDHRLFPMWEDLQKEPRLLRSAVRRFMEVTEQLGYAMGEEKLEEDVVVVVTSNIYLAIKKQNPTEQASNMVSWQFPPRFSLVNQNYSHNEFKERTTDSAAAALTSSTVSIHLPEAAAASLKSRKIVKNHVVFLSFRGLAPILQSHSADPILSLGVDPSLKQLLQARIRLPSSSSAADANTAMEVKEMHCYDALLQEKMGCNVAKWHNGTRECVCNGWLRGYALNVTMASSASSASMFDDVMMDLREELDGQTLLEEAMTTTMLVIVAVSATLLVASLLSAALLIIYCRRVKIQDKKWEEERHHQPWWLQNSRSKSSPSDSTGHQDSSGNGSIQTSSTLLLNSNRNYTSSLMSSASIISPYESAPHFHGTLNSHHLSRCPKNNQESSTWRRLLSSLKEPTSSRPKPGVTNNHHLTLGNHHNHHLNPENTLRLATHRQLFQFNNVEFPSNGAAADEHYDLHRSATAAGQDNNLFDGLGGHRSNESGLQYYASESSQGLNSSHHSSSSRWPPLLHPQTEAQIYQVPVDLEPPNYSRPLLNQNATRTMQERQQSRQTRLSHSAFVRSRQHSHGSPPTSSSAKAAAMAAEDLWLLQQNKFQDLSNSHARPNSHIYMDLDSSSSSESGNNGPATTTSTTRKSLSNYVVSQC